MSLPEDLNVDRMGPASDPLSAPGLFAELKRRKVFKVGAAYVLCAWLVIQAVSIAFPAFDAPPWALRVVILLALLGFPLTVVMAWAFESTPAGVRLDSRASGTKRIFASAGALVLLALGWYFFGQPAIRAGEMPASAPITVAAAANASAVSDVAAAVRVDRGVAVLPFTNFSADPDNAFFASGVFDEVLTRVSRIDGLRVISRTSMEKIASEKLEVPQIGRRLRISHVLEGSVQRSGGRVRITVQLIEAASDRHVWAEKYDRKLDDVFAIQSEIALAIAEQLKIALDPKQEAALGERLTDSSEAHDLYLRALQSSRAWTGVSGFRDQIALLEPAVRLDPGFLQAREMLVEAYGRMEWFGEDEDGSFKAKALAQVQEMESRWPARAETRQARGDYLYTVEQDYAAALAVFEPLAREQPNNGRIATHVASCYKRLERYPEQLVAARRALALDPEANALRTEMMIALQFNRRYEEAIALGEDIVRQFPEDVGTAMQLATLKFLYRGDDRALLAMATPAVLERGENPFPFALARFMRGDVDGAVGMLESAPSKALGVKLGVLVLQADFLKLAGRAQEARPYAQRALVEARRELRAHPPSGDTGALRLALSAAAAAQAGDSEQAQRWEALALAKPPRDLETAYARDDYLAMAKRSLGEVDAAWALVSSHTDSTDGFINPALPSLRRYFDLQYGESAAYRKFVASLKAKSP